MKTLVHQYREISTGKSININIKYFPPSERRVVWRVKNVGNKIVLVVQ